MFEISAKEISRVQSLLKSISKEEQILKFNLDENRSDVLIPALEITETVRTIISAKKILLPTVGLKEALILSKLENKKQKKKFIQQTLLEI
jgi:exopolyphosphatase / guanosine-5'-triphosphate,3'-diphosphate pyrophosphatase